MVFFTFKLAGLLIEPQINRDNKNYPLHRTSFWTILYGRSNFIQYNPWPLSWVNDNRWVRMLGRLIFVLALLPTLMMLVGTIVGLKNIQSSFDSNVSKSLIGLFILLLFAYLGFAILYAMEYRIYTVIKTIFIYPAIISLGVVFMLGYEWIKEMTLPKMPAMNIVYRMGIYALLIAYGVDISILVFQLAIIRGWQ